MEAKRKTENKLIFSALIISIITISIILYDILYYELLDFETKECYYSILSEDHRGCNGCYSEDVVVIYGNPNFIKYEECKNYDQYFEYICNNDIPGVCRMVNPKSWNTSFTVASEIRCNNLNGEDCYVDFFKDKDHCWGSGRVILNDSVKLIAHCFNEEWVGEWNEKQ